ncbi:MAG: 50S ribosomal protein L11 methyltransferase [Hyphomonadaceae bacterium]|nr:50S ribosomal protein L11 methyltransferase [Hyphomonadaceae bacterium]
MLLLTALGSLAQVRAAADELDRHDPSPADAVSWFEEKPGKFRLELYVPTKQDAASAQAIVGAAAPELHLKQKKLKDADWVAMSLEGLPAVRAGRFVVAGAHALAREHSGRTKIWIEASEAFGTGHHGTTWGCLMGLEHYLRRRGKRSHPFPGRGKAASPGPINTKVEKACAPAGALSGAIVPMGPGLGASRQSGNGWKVLDVGAGSGVLAIAAAKHGAEALAIEIDRRAAAIAAINVEQNKVAQRVRVIAGDGARSIAGKRFDLVFANILMRPLIRLAPKLVAATAPGGALILSGLLRTQAPLVREAYANRGLLLERQIPKEAWMTLVWRKPQRA